MHAYETSPETLGPSLIFCSSSCDVLRGLQKCAPPAFELSHKWVKRLKPEYTAIQANPTIDHSIGSRFFKSPWSHQIPSELWSILCSLKQLVLAFEEIEDSDSRSMPLENDHLVLLTNRLHSLSLDIRLTPFQEAIRLGTLIYLTIRVLGFEGNPCIENLIHALQKNFDYSLPDLATIAPDLLFWILFMSGIASQGFVSHIWCLNNLRICAKQNALRSWEDALSVLKGYLFVPRRRNDPAKCLWNSIALGMVL